MAEQGAYGGFWIRVLAYAVDSVILWIATFGLIVACAFIGPAGAVVAAIVPFLLPLLYFVGMQASARQATFGKALLGLKVGDPGGERISILRSLGRELAKIVSAIPLAIGFLIAAFTSRKQALHDFIASTVVTREGPGHVVAALAVVIVGYLGPVLLVMFLGAGILAGTMAMMGGTILGDMMSQQAAKTSKPPVVATPAKPAAAPAAAPAPSAATASDIDRLLAPLAGMERPNSVRAGPAVLELSTFFGGSGDPKVWIKVHVPPAVSAASVPVARVTDAAGKDRYDPKHNLESEFFQNLQLSAAGSGTPRMEGLRSVNLMKGTTEQDVQKIDGRLKLAVPVGVKTLVFRAGDAGKEQASGNLKLTLTALKGGNAQFSFKGARDSVVDVRGLDAAGKAVHRSSSSWSGEDSGTLSYTFDGTLERIEAAVAFELVRREYPFVLTRGGSPAVAATTPVAAAPAPAKPVAVVEPPKPALAPAKPLAVPEARKPAPTKATPPPSPEMSATAAPEVKAPKAKPASRRQAPAPKPATEPVAAAPSAPKTSLAPATPRGIPQPRYGDLVSAVLARDAKGVQELLDFGKWADKPDRRGTTPLMVAALLGDTASAEALLKAGADASKAESTAREKGDKAMLDLLQRYRATSRQP